MQQVLHVTPQHGQINESTLRATQLLHNLFSAEFHPRNGRIVNGYDTVARQYAHLLGRSATYRLNHQQGVFHHLELHTNTVEIALQGLIHLLYLIGIVISRVRIELLQHLGDGAFHQAGLIDAVNI